MTDRKLRGSEEIIGNSHEERGSKKSSTAFARAAVLAGMTLVGCDAATIGQSIGRGHRQDAAVQDAVSIRDAVNNEDTNEFSVDAGLDSALDAATDVSAANCPAITQLVLCGNSTTPVTVRQNEGIGITFEGGQYFEVIVLGVESGTDGGAANVHVQIKDLLCNTYNEDVIQAGTTAYEGINGHRLAITIGSAIPGVSAVVSLGDDDVCDAGIESDSSVDASVDDGATSDVTSATCGACIPHAPGNTFGSCSDGTIGVLAGLCGALPFGTHDLQYVASNSSIPTSTINVESSDCSTSEVYTPRVNQVGYTSSNISFISTYPNSPSTAPTTILEAWPTNCGEAIMLTSMPPECSGVTYQTFTIPLVSGDVEYQNQVYLGAFSINVNSIEETLSPGSGSSCLVTNESARIIYGPRSGPLTSIVMSPGQSDSGSFGVGCMSVGLSQISMTVSAPDPTTGTCSISQQYAVLTVSIPE